MPRFGEFWAGFFSGGGSKLYSLTYISGSDAQGFHTSRNLTYDADYSIRTVVHLSQLTTFYDQNAHDAAIWYRCPHIDAAPMLIALSLDTSEQNPKWPTDLNETIRGSWPVTVILLGGGWDLGLRALFSVTAELKLLKRYGNSDVDWYSHFMSYRVWMRKMQ